jgi:DNA-binding NtrC family response regulator
MAQMAEMLIVDDDTAVLEMLGAVMDFWGVDARQVSSAYEAQVFLSQHRDVRMLVTDIQMPGMSGLELADKARRLQPEIRLVAITGHALTPEQAELFEEVITKPADMERLRCLAESCRRAVSEVRAASGADGSTV